MTHPFGSPSSDGAGTSTSRSRPGSRCSSWPAATRGAGQAPGGGRAARAARPRAPRTSPCCATAARCGCPIGRARGRRPVRGAARRDDRHRRRGRRRQLRASTPSMLTGESVPVEVGPGDAVVGGMRQRRRPAGGARHPGRRRHPARPHGPPRRGRAERQGRRAAARRPGVGRVRAGRDRARGRRRSGFWLGAGAGATRRVHRRGRRADHRLPVRAGPGHADGAARRHRPGRPARHPDQGPGGAGVHPAGRHRRARQDRHRHHGQDGAAPCTSATGEPTRRSAWPPRRAGARSTRSARAIVAAARERFGELPDVAEFDNAPGLGVRGVVSEIAGDVIVAHAVLVGRARAARRARHRAARRARRGRRRRREAEGTPPSPSPGTGWPAACSPSATRWRPTAPTAVARLRGARPAPDPAHRRQPRRGAWPSRPQVGIADDEVIAEVLPEDKVAAVRAAAGRRAGRRHGRRRRQRRGGARRRRPRHRDGHRHRRGDRGERHHARARRPARRRRRDPARPAHARA